MQEGAKLSTKPIYWALKRVVHRANSKLPSQYLNNNRISSQQVRVSRN